LSWVVLKGAKVAYTEEKNLRKNKKKGENMLVFKGRTIPGEETRVCDKGKKKEGLKGTEKESNVPKGGKGIEMSHVRRKVTSNARGGRKLLHLILRKS